MRAADGEGLQRWIYPATYPWQFLSWICNIPSQTQNQCPQVLGCIVSPSKKYDAGILFASRTRVLQLFKKVFYFCTPQTGYLRNVHFFSSRFLMRLIPRMSIFHGFLTFVGAHLITFKVHCRYVSLSSFPVCIRLLTSSVSVSIFLSMTLTSEGIRPHSV